MKNIKNMCSKYQNYVYVMIDNFFHPIRKAVTSEVDDPQIKKRNLRVVCDPGVVNLYTQMECQKQLNW